MDMHFGGRKKVLLFACMKDKDYAAIIKSFKGVFESVVVTLADETRGADPDTLRNLFSDFTQCTAEKDIPTAFDMARKEAAEQDAMLVVCGSFYLAGKVSGLI
jgi:folylpolyglutamate synthase/dihydropteroate synthase